MSGGPRRTERRGPRTDGVKPRRSRACRRAPWSAEPAGHRASGTGRPGHWLRALLASVRGVRDQRPAHGRLALRQVVRHRTESLLVVLGSVLGTALIVASFVVGDSLDRSVRQSAYEVLGPVDGGDRGGDWVPRLVGEGDLFGRLPGGADRVFVCRVCGPLTAGRPHASSVRRGLVADAARAMLVGQVDAVPGVDEQHRIVDVVCELVSPSTAAVGRPRFWSRRAGGGLG
jgi:hypothetical protein